MKREATLSLAVAAFLVAGTAFAQDVAETAGEAAAETAGEAAAETAGEAAAEAAVQVDAADEAEALTLDEIVVDGAFWGESKVRPVFGQHVDAPRVETVNAWLERATGVFGDQGGKGYRDVIVRGFMTRQINFQFDGVPLDTGYDGMTALDTMPVNWMGGGRISHADSGPTDAVGLGGKIDFYAAMPEKLEAGVEVSRSGVVGSLAHGMSLGPWRWAVTGGGQYSSGFYLSHAFKPTIDEDGGLRDASEKKGGNLLVKAGRSLGNWGDLEVFAGWSQAPRDVPTGVNVDRKRYWRFVSQRVALASARLTFDASVIGGQIQAWATEQGNTQESYDDASRSTQKGTAAYESLWDDQEYGGRIDLESVQFGPGDGGFKALLRADMRYQSHDSNELMLLSGHVTEKSSSRFWYDIRPALEWDHGEQYRVFASAGVNGAVMLSQKDSGMAQRLDLNDLVDGSMSIGADFHVIPELMISLRVARRLRLPTLKEQFRSIPVSDTALPDLNAEVAWNTGLEIGWTPHEKVSMTVGAYDTEARDLIEFKYVDTLKVAYNVDSARIAGVDAAFRLGPWAGVSFDLAYQYLYAWDLSDDHALNDRPAHHAKLGVNYAPLECLRLSVMGRFESRRRTESWLGAPVAWLGSVYLLDAEIEYKMEHFSAYLKGTNLLDYNYQRNYGFPEAGIGFQFGAKIVL